MKIITLAISILAISLLGVVSSSPTHENFTTTLKNCDELLLTFILSRIECKPDLGHKSKVNQEFAVIMYHSFHRYVLDTCFKQLIDIGCPERVVGGIYNKVNSELKESLVEVKTEEKLSIQQFNADL